MHLIMDQRKSDVTLGFGPTAQPTEVLYAAMFTIIPLGEHSMPLSNLQLATNKMASIQYSIFMPRLSCYPEERRITGYLQKSDTV